MSLSEYSFQRDVFYDRLETDPKRWVSVDGRALLQRQPDLLALIDAGISHFRTLEAASGSFTDAKGHGVRVELAEGVSMAYRWPGGQGTLFLLTLPEEDNPMVIKMRDMNRDTHRPVGISQPFWREAAQILNLKQAVGAEIAALGISFRPYYIAGDMVACYPYIDAPIADFHDGSFRDIVARLSRIVDPYIEKQVERGSQLWNGVEADLYTYRGVERDENFLLPNGNYESMVWIDPFYAGVRQL